jgi:hypothetical protein
MAHRRRPDARPFRRMLFDDGDTHRYLRRHS